MADKPITPYQRLKRRGAELFGNIVYCRRKTMFTLKAAGGTTTFRLSDVLQRIHAAQQIGFEVVAVAEGEDIRLEYRPARPETIPYEFRL
jgi:hypothetical protein